jgi:hypothetical protein
VIAAAIGRKSDRIDLDAAFRGDPGGTWPPKEVTRRIRARENPATTIPRRYSDELLGRERCREFLRSGRSFAFNATNLLRLTRQRWIDLFADYQARIEIVYVEPPLSVILAQNKRRERPVPEKVIRGLATRCEPPTITEAHGLVFGEPPSLPRRRDDP